MSTTTVTPTLAVAGNTANRMTAWLDLTADRAILQGVTGFRFILDDTPMQIGLPREYKFNKAQSQFIDDHIKELVQKGAIAEIWSLEDCFVSNIFLRPKPNASFRMILDLSELNRFLTKIHFKMDTLDTAGDMVFKGAWMASIDLQDAFYTIPVHKDHQKLLVFQWKGRFFKFVVLPFGLSQAPWIFTKVLRPVFAEFHRQGFQGFGYIDDSFIIAKTRQDCDRAVLWLVKKFEDLGFTVNREKSALMPTRRLRFLGYWIDSRDSTVRPTLEKSKKAEKVTSGLLKARKPTIKQVASVLGLTNDLCKGSDFGGTYNKRLEIEKIEALKRAGRLNFKARMKLSERARSDLKWWLTNVRHCKRKIRVTPPSRTISTDASGLGWGASLSEVRTGGRWSISEASLHINVLELKAIELSIQALLDNAFNQEIQVQTDNTTAVAYINHKGGTRSRACNEVARDIWTWCEKRKIWIEAVHLPGALNVEADYESRHFTDDTEWSLNPLLFDQICNKWGTPRLDLFASRLNHKVRNYVSWCPDPGAQFVNAFARSWSNLGFLYIFPPFRLLHRVVRKIRVERPERAVVVAPDWWGQTYLPALQELAKDDMRVPKQVNNLQLPHRPSQAGGPDFHDIPLRIYLIC